MPNTIAATTTAQRGDPQRAEDDRADGRSAPAEVDRARGADDRHAVDGRQPDTRDDRDPDHLEQGVRVDDRGDHPGTSAASATDAMPRCWARRSNMNAAPATIRIETTIGPAAPVPKILVTL